MTVSSKEKQDESIQKNIPISSENKPEDNSSNNTAVPTECKADKNNENNLTVSSEGKQDGIIEKNIRSPDEIKDGLQDNHMTFLSDGPQDGSRIVQYVAGFTSNLGIICSEMHYGWTSPFLPVLMGGNYYYIVNDEEVSYTTIMPLLGSIVGALITWITVDTFGRQKLLTYSSLPFIASWLLVGIARSSILLFVGRFLGGISMAITFIVVPMYLGEIADAATKGPLFCMCQICGAFGFLVVNFMGTLLRLDTVAYLSACLPILLLLFFSYMPESPYFCLMKNDTEGARISLQTLRGRKEIFDELERISEAVKEHKENKGKLSDLVTVTSNRKALILCLGLRGFQQLCGVSVIIFYCQTLFKETEQFISPNIASLIFFLAQLIFLTFASYWIDMARRKTFLLVSTTGTTLALLANGIYFYLKNCTNVNVNGLEFITIISLLGFIIVFSMGMHTIPHFMIEELFPANMKMFAFCLLNLYFDVIVIIITKMFDWSKYEFGMHVPFIVFTAFSFLGTGFVIFFVPETKGKTLEIVEVHLPTEKISEMKC